MMFVHCLFAKVKYTRGWRNDKIGVCGNYSNRIFLLFLKHSSELVLEWVQQ